MLNISIAKITDPNTPKDAIYVGRTPRFGGPHPLANSFSHLPHANAIKVDSLENCLIRYKQFLWQCLKNTHPNLQFAAHIRQSLNDLLSLARSQPITLACHCTPARCHASIIKNCLLWLDQNSTK
ncbi:MAG: DUF4326 domain-containing protein [Acidobacteria bacterium]|nr:DUF4326 domain-containing protein [Acidobacteriota bacterium]